MEFSEFKDKVYTDWQRRIISICWIGFFLILFFELLIFAVFFKMEYIASSLPVYLFLRVILPSGMNFIAAVMGLFVFKSNRFTVSQKNCAACFSIFILGSVVAIFHNYYKFLLCANGIPIVICAIFADKKLLRSVLYSTYVSFLIACWTMWNDDRPLPLVDFLTTVVCAFLFIQIIYMVAKNIVNYQSEQIDFIYSISQKQMELIQELKIEPLTKLYNRTALCGALASFVKKFQNGFIKPHMVLIDIDHFKEINDTFGHACGDKVLKALARIIKENMHGIRRAFRYGGEEFILLFENETSEQVYDVVEKIRKEFFDEKYDFAGESHFTVSAGISKLNSQWNDTTWFNSADAAMYRAKENGRNQIIVSENY